MADIVKAEKNELFSKEDIEAIKAYDNAVKTYKVWYDSQQERFKAFLAERGDEPYTQNGVSLYRTKDYKKKQVDTKKMKEEGVYDLYTRDVWVKGSVRIQVNYDD